MMKLYFTDDEMAEFLLTRGYVIMLAVEEVETNQYQNVFRSDQREILKAFKGDYSDELVHAFEREMKNQLLNL